MISTNIQAPSTRETSNSNVQPVALPLAPVDQEEEDEEAEAELEFGSWSFSGAWMLVLGVSFIVCQFRPIGCSRSARVASKGGFDDADLRSARPPFEAIQ